MAVVKDDGGNVLLTAIRTPPHPMVMFETGNIRNDETVEFFVDSLIRNNIYVDLVMTEKELAASFCDNYGRCINKSFTNNQSLVLYVLEKVSALTLPGGKFRVAANDDMFYLPYWFADFAPACHIGEYNLENGIHSAQKTIDLSRAYIWDDIFELVRRHINTGINIAS